MEEIFELEEANLAKAVEEKLPVKIVIINGFKMDGIIEDYDRNVIICRSRGKRKMVYRHAVSTIEME